MQESTIPQATSRQHVCTVGRGMRFGIPPITPQCGGDGKAASRHHTLWRFIDAPRLDGRAVLFKRDDFVPHRHRAGTERLRCRICCWNCSARRFPRGCRRAAAEDLARLLGEALTALSPRDIETFHGPRRIAMAATLAAGVAESRSHERGPRVSAPEQALAGFLRKHGASREALRQEGEFWVLDRLVPGQVAAVAVIAAVMPGLLRRFPWPKSMRWGGTSAVHLGAPAAPHPVHAGRRGGPVRTAPGRG